MIKDLMVQADFAEYLFQRHTHKKLSSVADTDLVAQLFSRNANVNGLHIDELLDWRIAHTAVVGSLWRRDGGIRIRLSDSVAAALVVTKSPRCDLKLPLNSFIIEVPKGFMPSPVDGEYSGSILVHRHNTGRITCIAQTDRPGGSGISYMWFNEDSDEDSHRTADIRETKGIEPTSRKHLDNSAVMKMRMIRNLAAWMTAFPSKKTAVRGLHKVNVGEVGVSIQDGQLIYLKTEVVLNKDIRDGAKCLVNNKSSFETKKLALKHIVRGHWKEQSTKAGAKTIWIAPYWRGPDGATAWGRVYSA